MYVDSSEHACLRGSGLGRHTWNGDEHSLPSLDDSEGCVTPLGFSKNLGSSQHRRLLPTKLLPQLHNSATQSLKSQRPCGGGQSQYIATCSGLRPPRSDGQARSGTARRANYAKLKGRFTAEARRVRNSLPPRMPEWLPSATNLTRISPGLTPYGRRVQKALCYRAPHKFADGSVTLELLPGPPDCCTLSAPAGACTASCCSLLEFGKETRPWEVKRFWSCHLQRWRTTRRPSVNSPLPTTTCGGCSSVPRTKPVVSAWPWLELPGLRLTKPAEALLTRSMHCGRKSPTQSRARTNPGQHRAGTRLGTLWPGVRTVLCRSSASQPSRGSRMPTTVALQSLIVSGSLLLRQPQFATAVTQKLAFGCLAPGFVR